LIGFLMVIVTNNGYRQPVPPMPWHRLHGCKRGLVGVVSVSSHFRPLPRLRRRSGLRDLNGADSRAVSVKAVSTAATWLNLLFGAAQASVRFHAAAGRQPVAPSGAAFAAYPQSLRSLRYSTTAKPRLSRQLATPPKPRVKPFGRAPSSLKARRLRKAGST
jgi:hypothetical protein